MAITADIPGIRQGYDPSVTSSYPNALGKPMYSAVDIDEKPPILTN
jgi:hypothetical protein